MSLHVRFCVAPIHQGHKFREKSAKVLVDEIERGYRDFGLTFFYLWGDTVTLNVKSFSAFCEELIARKLPVQWFGNARADNLDGSGVRQAAPSSRLLDAGAGHRDGVGRDAQGHVKRLDGEKIRAALTNMRAAGIHSFAFFIMGYPGDTPAPSSARSSTQLASIPISQISIRPCRIRERSSTTRPSARAAGHRRLDADGIPVYLLRATAGRADVMAAIIAPGAASTCGRAMWPGMPATREARVTKWNVPGTSVRACSSARRSRRGTGGSRSQKSKVRS